MMKIFDHGVSKKGLKHYLKDVLESSKWSQKVLEGSK